MEYDSHLHWEFVAYEHQDEKGYHYSISISVIGFDTEEDALIRAKQIVTRPFYKLNRVWECVSCNILKRNIESLEKFVDKMPDDL